MIEFYNDSPNLTILLPVGCNAKCDFCFWTDKSDSNYNLYLKRLSESLSSLPEEISQVSISGGEPTMLPKDIFKNIISIIKYDAPQIKKVVLNTNGYLLDSFLDEKWFYDTVDHINVSRHDDSDVANSSIFNTDTIPNTSRLKHICRKANRLGIDITLNKVYEYMYQENVFDMVQYAKTVGASAIAFRQDIKLGLRKSAINKRIGHKPIVTSSCDVCMVEEFLIVGMKTFFKYGVLETEGFMSKNVLYELILGQDGKIYSDWNCRNEVSFARPIEVSTPSYEESSYTPCSISRCSPEPVKPTPYRGCGFGYGGCR